MLLLLLLLTFELADSLLFLALTLKILLILEEKKDAECYNGAEHDGGRIDPREYHRGRAWSRWGRCGRWYRGVCHRRLLRRQAVLYQSIEVSLVSRVFIDGMLMR